MVILISWRSTSLQKLLVPKYQMPNARLSIFRLTRAILTTCRPRLTNAQRLLVGEVKN